MRYPFLLLNLLAALFPTRNLIFYLVILSINQDSFQLSCNLLWFTTFLRKYYHFSTIDHLPYHLTSTAFLTSQHSVSVSFGTLDFAKRTQVQWRAQTLVSGPSSCPESVIYLLCITLDILNDLPVAFPPFIGMGIIIPTPLGSHEGWMKYWRGNM